MHIWLLPVCGCGYYSIQSVGQCGYGIQNVHMVIKVYSVHVKYCTEHGCRILTSWKSNKVAQEQSSSSFQHSFTPTTKLTLVGEKCTWGLNVGMCGRWGVGKRRGHGVRGLGYVRGQRSINLGFWVYSKWFIIKHSAILHCYCTVSAYRLVVLQVVSMSVF